MSKERKIFENFVDLASSRNGGKILFATDDWFAEAENLLNPEDPVFKVGLFTEFGKWMDGWETRRKRKPGHDWCIIKLGASGVIRGIDVDTAYFTGNYSPRFSLQAAVMDRKDEDMIPARPDNSLGTESSWETLSAISKLRSEEWTEIIPMTPLRPGFEASRHNYFNVTSHERWTHLRLNIYPDGGVARLRVYGEISTNTDNFNGQEVDLLAMSNGGVCQLYSDAHYGHPKNLTRPGRGKDMGDGWETARRLDRPPVLEADERDILVVPGNEWVIFRLGCVGAVSRVEIDTAHFKGNYPDSAKLEGAHIYSVEEEIQWSTILPASKLSPDHIHHYSSTNLVSTGPFTHIKFTIAPDGGVSRLRIFGYPRSILPDY